MPGAFLIARGQSISDVGVGATDDGLLLVEPLSVPGVARQLTATNAAQSQQLTSSCRRLSIRCRNNNCRFTVGTVSQSSVVSATTSHFILSGERLDIAIPAGSHIGYIRDAAAGADGILEITELL